MDVPARVSLATLGVRDVAASARFYEALGWRRSSASVDGVVAFFPTGGAVLALYGRDALAADAGLAPEGAAGSRSVSLAINVDEKAHVDAATERARAAGARVTKTPADTEWGGRVAYFEDPDGHLWEIAWNPGFPMDARGILLPP